MAHYTKDQPKAIKSHWLAKVPTNGMNYWSYVELEGTTDMELIEWFGYDVRSRRAVSRGKARAHYRERVKSGAWEFWRTLG